MSDHIHKQKKLISNTLFLLFLALAVSSAFLSDALKSPVKTHNEFIEETLVFGVKELENITQIQLINKTGSYSFSYNEENWLMTMPKEYNKNSIFIEKLFNSLKIIKTKKQIEENPANISRFSLDNPSATLILSGENKTITIGVGIMNTIDNSTYVKIAERSGIYHIEAPSSSLENITIADLIETKTFDFKKENLESFKLSKKKSSNSSFSIARLTETGNWNDSADSNFDQNQIDDFLNQISLIKSHIVLTEPTSAQTSHAQKAQQGAEVEIQTKNFSGTTVTYKVSAPIKSFPALSLNDEFHIIVTRNDTNAIHFVKAENLDLFENRLNLNKSKN